MCNVIAMMGTTNQSAAYDWLTYPSKPSNLVYLSKIGLIGHSTKVHLCFSSTISKPKLFLGETLMIAQAHGVSEISACKVILSADQSKADQARFGDPTVLKALASAILQSSHKPTGYIFAPAE
jgi:hypothetical protein